MCALRTGRRQAGPLTLPQPTLYYSDIFSGVGLPEGEILSGRCQKKRNVTRENPFPQLPVVEGSLRWTSSGPGASEGSSHSTLASSPAGQRPPPPVPPSCLLPSSSANDRGGCQLACCRLVQQQLFIYPFATCRFWAQCYRGSKTDRERGSGTPGCYLGPWSRTGGPPSHQSGRRSP